MNYSNTEADMISATSIFAMFGLNSFWISLSCHLIKKYLRPRLGIEKCFVNANTLSKGISNRCRHLSDITGRYRADFFHCSLNSIK